MPPVLLRGDGNGGFTDVTAASGLAGVTGYFDAEVLDLEGDGDRDLIFQSYGQEVLLANDGQGHFANVSASSGLVDGSQTQDVAIGDVNGDGRPDVFVTNWNGPFRLSSTLATARFRRCPDRGRRRTAGRRSSSTGMATGVRTAGQHDTRSWF